ncbi:ATP-dependent DNA helicase homolog RECG, chloroplastic isoform X9 [Magnolia sinica]|uniref:ATP-dependent DNA helicase homolog RECG, chloroplastic isoform X9 n=1 Tax=Magnolia sinica TaxID=86752 RepID=UPI002658A20B|nr:ATP-dependent DNA helicase homolog RECG, chloroplastic isoform X9 [Magnolia sinica]
MAQVASMAKACCMNFNEKYLTSAICFEAERGYRNAFGRNMRFSNFLQSNLLKLCSRSYHKSAQRLLEEVNGYGTASMSDRSKLLNKVSVLMGYCNVQDLIEHVKAGRVSDDLEGDVDDVDISLARRRFPSIILGSSSLVQLYDDNACQPDQMGLLLAENCGGFLLSSIGENWVEPDKLSEAWSLLDAPQSNLKSSSLDTGSYYILPFLSQSTALEAKGKSDAIHVEEAEGKSDVVNVEANMKDSSINAGGTAQQIETSSELIFDRPISCTPGISTRHCRQLEKSGFHTMRKLLHHFPRTYCDLKNARGAIDDGDYLIFAGKVLSSRGIKAGFSFSFLEVVVGCEFASDEGTSEVESDDCVIGESKMIYLHLKKFFRGTRFTSQPFLTSIESKHKEGDLVYVSGKVREMKKKDHYEMREYTVDKLEEEEESSAHGEGRPYPVYPSKGGLLPSFLRDIISRALQALSMNIDPIPDNICEEFGLLRLYDAYMGIHRPRDLEEADLARRRLVFDEFFYLQLGRLFQMLEVLGTRIEKDGLLDKYRNHEPTAISMDGWSSLTKKLLKALPYSLTPSQLNAVSEIIWDLKRPIPMNRLLQGDVGCGKTVVAFLACMEVIGSGFQLYSVSSNFRTSATSWNESSTEKAYMAPHILSMSATPIPRTLALALYGDMSLTQITDLPPGRKPVETFVLEGNESGFEDVYQMMREELLREGKVYLVYPVIEESEQLPQLHAAAADLESISAKFEDYQCGLLHGRMKSDEKDEALRRFRSGETHILLSTQVIEIGVDVPDASMMVVMNAERFGIAQLHQLRGRVGRGTKKSKCVFLASSSGALNRLKVLEKSCDGFYLANMDLMLRGPGNLLGKKQSGHLPDFPIARLEIDGNILQEAHLAALKILSASHDLESFPKLKAELSMRQPLCLLGD